MRIRIVRKPSGQTADGIDLKRFVRGQQYDVGNRIGALLLAEGWAVPVEDDEPSPPMPFSGSDPFMPRLTDGDEPPNLVRETYPPSVDETTAMSADFERRRRRRPRRR